MIDASYFVAQNLQVELVTRHAGRGRGGGNKPKKFREFFSPKTCIFLANISYKIAKIFVKSQKKTA